MSCSSPSPTRNRIPGVRTVPYPKPQRRGGRDACRSARTGRGRAARGDRGAYGGQPEAAGLRAGHHHRPSRLGRTARTSAMSGPTRRCSAIWNSIIASTASMSVSIRNSRRRLRTTRASGRRTPSTCWRSTSARMRRRRPGGSCRPIPCWARNRITLLPEGVEPRCVQAEPAGATPQPDDRRNHDQAEREAGHLCRARSGAVSRLSCDDARGAAPAACAQGHPRGDGGRRRHQLRHAAQRKAPGGEKMLAELGDAIDPARVLFPGRARL